MINPRKRTAIGRYLQLDEEIDYVKLATNISLSAAIGFVTGKASEKLLSSIAARTSATWKLDRDIARALARRRTDAPYKQFLADFFTKTGANLTKDAIQIAAKKAKGKKLSRTQFVKLVGDEIVKQLSSSAGKQLLDSFAGTYGK